MVNSQEKYVESHHEYNFHNKTILKNPKLDTRITVDPKEKKGLFTNAWREKINKFIKSCIPSCIKDEQILWLDSPQKILEFIERINNPDCDLSYIDYVCISSTISDIYDIINFFLRLGEKLPEHAKIIYSNYNWKWGFLFILTGMLGITCKRDWGNFYRDKDLDCFLDMSGWENIKELRKYIFPFNWGIVSTILDGIFRLPVLRGFTLNTIFIARKKGRTKYEERSVTILIPCKNESENIEAIVTRIPNLGKFVELLFINDKSTDDTEIKILHFKEELPDKIIKLVQGKGKGKGEAIRTGMEIATGDICMILDADLTVVPEDLTQFYEAINTRRADFINGTRLVYAPAKEAMRPLNIIGNIFFSNLFSFILDQRITDTLCGTKVFWKRDWPLFEEMRSVLKMADVWGDYNLIFGAARFGLKIGELPVRYFPRLKGFTKMTNRFKNGLIMLRVAWQALCQIKFSG